MVFVPGYKHDIFVSYARVDDQPAPGANEGWVTTLVKGLKIELAQRLGRSEAYSLWMDHQLAGNVQITPEIMNTLRHTATFLVILSRGYLASYWCQKEKNSFLSMVQKRVRSGSRVFVVERDRLESTDRPPEFGDLRGYRFWVVDREGKPPRILGVPKPQPDDLRYYDLLNELSYDLASELQRLHQLEKPAELTKEEILSIPDNRAKVFLAEGTDDLYAIREDVKRFLTQAKLQVLPETYYSYEPQAFQDAVRKDIGKSDLYVQLLSGIPGRKAPELPQGYVRCQYEIAQDMKKPILQWRSPELVLETVENSDHCNFLQCETILAIGLEDFKSEIIKKIFPPSPPRFSTSNIGVLIFIDAETSSDSALVSKICQVLDRFGVGYILPLQSEKPSENREAFEQYVLDCDALVIVYGGVTVKWVSDQLLAIRKIFQKRERPLTLAIFDGPSGPESPKQKPPLTFKLPNMRILDCRDCVDEKKLLDFIESLQKGETTP